MRLSTRRVSCLAAAAVLVCWLPPATAAASYGIFVGRNLTADGCTYLAGYGDEPSSHWLEIVPAREHPPGSTIRVGATAAARYPGELIEIPQVARTARYLTMNYSAFAGFPAPLTNGGLNEHHVAARDIWSPSREELRRMTPNPQRGLNYSDLSRIAMERARSAREAVEIVGGLIDQYGYCTYGGNSHLFADAEEGWILIEFAGGQGLWVAERLGPDAVRVSRPGYILEVPLDYQSNPEFRGSPNLISFAVEQGWFDPAAGEPFHVNRVYGDGQERHPAVSMMEERLAALGGSVTLSDVMAAVRTPELTRDSAGYGQVAPLYRDKRQELGVLWVAATTPAAAPFVPYYLGTTRVPPEFGWHRYLTEGEAAQFMAAERRGQESTRFAFQTFKRLFYLVEEHPEEFGPEVAAALGAFERRLLAEQADVERTAETLFAAGEHELARRYLTYYSGTEASCALRLGEALAEGIEARTKVLFGIRGLEDGGAVGASTAP